MIRRRPLASAQMDRTGSFLLRLPPFETLLQPMVFGFYVFLHFFKCPASHSNLSRSSGTRHCSLTEFAFKPFLPSLFFLNGDTADILRQTGSVAPLIGLLPYWPLVDNDAG